MSDFHDVVEISPLARDGLNKIGLGDFQTTELPDRMAWIVLVLRKLPDDREWFPHGKWATIQHIDEQLADCAEQAVLDLSKP